MLVTIIPIKALILCVGLRREQIHVLRGVGWSRTELGVTLAGARFDRGGAQSKHVTTIAEYTGTIRPPWEWSPKDNDPRRWPRVGGNGGDELPEFSGVVDDRFERGSVFRDERAGE